MEAVAAGGQVLQGIGGYEAGQFNARVDRANARQGWIDATGQEADVSMRARAAMGEQIAEQGAGGFQIGTGSNLDALQQSATARQMDLMNIRRQAQTRANAYGVQAQLDKAQGTAALAKGLFGAAASMSKGFADAAYQRAQAYGTSASPSGAFSDWGDWTSQAGSAWASSASGSDISAMSGYSGGF